MVYSGDETGRRIGLTEGRNTIGSSAAASVQIDDASLSRMHAELAIDGVSFVLRDLGSTNGSQVQDQPVSGRHLLRDGELLRLGSVVLKF